MCKPVNLHADSCSSSGAGASSSAVVTPVHSTIPVSSVPATSVPVSSVPATESTPAVSPSGYPGSGSGTSVWAPASSSSPPLAGSPYTVLTTVTVTDCSCSATPGVPAPGGGSSVPGSQPSGSASGSPAPATTPIVSSQPGGPASISATSPSVFTSVPASGSSVPTSSASVAPSATGSSSGSCPTDLSGDYEYPHLIIPVDSSSPDTAPGTSYNGTVTSSISSLFNFDIPSSDSGKTCSLVFLFPQKQDLETSSYSFSGDGQIDFAQLSSPASSSTSYSNMPSVSQDFGTTTVSPGNSYVISTFSCPAGQTVGYEMKNAGSTDLNFFEDYNPSPLGLYITVC